jgi:hypothetical protein
MESNGGTNSVKTGKQIERIASAIRELSFDAVWLLLNLGDGDAKPNAHARPFGSAEQDLVQLQSGQGAKRRHSVIAEKELMLDDQASAPVEKKHAIVTEARCEYLIEHTERVVDTERVGRLTKSHPGNVKSFPPLNEDNFHPAPSQDGSRREPANSTANH